jgi:hypothetical protein
MTAAMMVAMTGDCLVVLSAGLMADPMDDPTAAQTAVLLAVLMAQ